MWLDGSTVGLTTPDENIDGMETDGSTWPIVSLSGKGKVPMWLAPGQLTVDDSDLIRLVSGGWIRDFVGAEHSLTTPGENIGDFHYVPGSRILRFHTTGPFQVPGATGETISGRSNTILTCNNFGGCAASVFNVIRDPRLSERTIDAFDMIPASPTG